MAFMELAMGAIGVGIILMIAYVVIAQAKSSMPADADANITNALNSSQSTVFAGFGLIAVGVIVIAAFGIVNLWK